MMRNSRLALCSVLLSGLLSSLAPPLCARQQTDPFYTNLLQKAEKSFIARNYAEAARDLEIAAFGLGGNKVPLARALVYLSISRYYLKDIAASEQNLQQAAAVMADEALAGLELHESARPILRKLLAYFGIPQPQAEPLAGESPVPEPKPVAGADALDKPAGEKTAEPDNRPRNPSPEPQPVLKLDELKEGDLVPLELVDTRPAVVKRVPAVYPSTAGARSIEGTVVVNALISETGSVLRTEIGRSMKNYAGFDQAAARAVLQWEFDPAVVNGTRVKVWLPVAIKFQKRS